MQNEKESGQLRQELELLIAKDPNGLLLPETVVTTAADPASPLHKYFTWDDSEAAARWRITEARQLIQSVRVYIAPLDIRVRAFTSLGSDRLTGAGFRKLTDVMEAPDLRQQFLITAYKELTSLESRYGHLEELTRVFEAAHDLDSVVSDRKVKQIQVTKAEGVEK